MTEPIEARRCADCHALFLPPRLRCPRCGSASTRPTKVPSSATVLASTELAVPPPGFGSPHHLTLIEFDEGLRMIVASSSGGHAPGSKVEVRAAEGGYRIVGPG